MSSDYTPSFPACDSVQELSESYKLFIKVVGPFVPSLALRQGDKAQALTLRLLEESKEIMDEDLHDELQYQYGQLVQIRRHIKGGPMGRMKRYADVSLFLQRALRLNGRTVTLSRNARDQDMWKKKGKNGFYRLTLRRRASTTSELTIMTAKEGRGDQPAPPSPNLIADSESVDITDQPEQTEPSRARTQTKPKTRMWEAYIRPSEIDPYRDGESTAHLSINLDAQSDDGESDGEAGVNISVRFGPTEEEAAPSESELGDDT
ncbi:uncharacterized protein B0H18DRAFT_1025292 [Fomitopsis serialis]|uniref:uncharacterized protein n=1 Tax=Fomitopsis serialis TaxID=139415 RepID=UPI002007C610|nr:uncharacterized protein B0H18DRAFT_1025292 [Neoantrodia serialis]KAH9920139.1 hypothetical protein B0H18DRAFT_1025292 [Neoantrodia serialis]